MKFYIEVKHPTMGIINSETYDVETPEQFKKIKDSIINAGDLKLDFYDDEGTYVVIKEGIVMNSLIYFRVLR